MVDFCNFLKDVRQKGQYHLQHIRNMNKIPMYIDLGPNKTLNRVGDKTVSIRITGAEKCHLTIVLSCTANGDIHLPMIIFKRKTEPKVKTPTGFVVTANGKGWRYELLMKIFITDIWMKKVGELPPHHGLLPFYYTDMVMRALQQRKIMPAIIPDGCISILQPLDVSINKPFKLMLRKYWTSWICDQANNKATQMIKPPTAQLVKTS